MIVSAAIQEDVDVIGLSILSGAHMTLVPRVQELLREQGRDDVLLIVGGIVSPDDMTALEERGVAKFFGPGTPTGEIVAYITAWARDHLT
jgi:methylmalonyl-CoA mutase C-terminal domain/subunit